MAKLRSYGDYILYKTIILTLRQNGHKVTDKSIVHHFKVIAPDQYEKDEIEYLLSDLKNAY